MLVFGQKLRLPVENAQHFVDQAAQADAVRLLQKPVTDAERAGDFPAALHLVGRFQAGGGIRRRDGRQVLLLLCQELFEIFRLDQLILATREKIAQVVKELARVVQLLVKFKLQFFNPPAQKNPQVDLVEQLPVEMLPLKKLITEGVEGGDADLLFPIRFRVRQGGADPMLHLLRGPVGEGEA